MTNRGFVELHNPMGVYIIAIGFLLVTLIVAAGGVFSKMIERESVQRRKEMKQAKEEAAKEEAAKEEAAKRESKL